jgi:hypothetical protein
VGIGIVYPREMGNARASEFGMSNSFDSRAFSFVFFRNGHNEIPVLGVHRRKKAKENTLKSNRYE